MIYEYKCPKCEHKQEENHSIKFDGEIKCAKCNEVTQKFISGGSGMLFKGPGFYANDYKKY